MELHAQHIILPMPQRHNMTFIVRCRYLEFVRKFCRIYYPTMIASCRKLVRQASEQVGRRLITGFIPANYFHGHGNTMIHGGKIQQSSAKYLSYGLVAQANTQDGLAGRIFFYQRKQQPGLNWQAGSRR